MAVPLYTDAEPSSRPAVPAEPPASQPVPRRESSVLRLFSHTFLIGWALLTTMPLLWAVVTSFKSDEEILTDAWGLPSELRWENFARAWGHAHIGQYFLNSAI